MPGQHKGRLHITLANVLTGPDHPTPCGLGNCYVGDERDYWQVVNVWNVIRREERQRERNMTWQSDSVQALTKNCWHLPELSLHYCLPWWRGQYITVTATGAPQHGTVRGSGKFVSLFRPNHPPWWFSRSWELKSQAKPSTELDHPIPGYNPPP